MTNALTIDNFRCDYYITANSSTVVYMLYPQVVGFMPSEWVGSMANKYGISIVMVNIPDDQWNDALTPWPEAGETPQSPAFAGHGDDFIKLLQQSIIPQCEAISGVPSHRYLVGVSLAGLFTLWQWLQYSTFESIACLSGSFWYPGFMDWFDSRNIEPKSGRAIFLLGLKEPKAWIKAYRCVGVNTESIVSRLKSYDINVDFEWVPGNHTAFPLQRAEAAIKYLCDVK